MIIMTERKPEKQKESGPKFTEHTQQLSGANRRDEKDEKLFSSSLASRGTFFHHPCILPSPAIQFLYFKVGIEVEDNALRRLRGCDDPATVLMGGIFQRVARCGDVAGVACV